MPRIILTKEELETLIRDKYSDATNFKWNEELNEVMFSVEAIKTETTKIAPAILQKMNEIVLPKEVPTPITMGSDESGRQFSGVF